MPIPTAEIQKRITYHEPSPLAKAAHGRIRDYIERGLLFCNTEIPEGRENSLAVTKLEEAMFWMNAAVARNHDKL